MEELVAYMRTCDRTFGKYMTEDLRADNESFVTVEIPLPKWREILNLEEDVVVRLQQLSASPDTQCRVVLGNVVLSCVLIG